MDTTKTKKSISRPIRFSPEEVKLLAKGAHRHGMSEAAYVRMLVHQDARSADQQDKKRSQS